MYANQPLAWTNQQRQLSELIPWARNPRRIGADQAKRLNESLLEFAQVETIAIGPSNEIYNGHQRLKAWAEQYGDLKIDVRVSNRALTEKEREKLTIFLHKGAAGEWDFEKLIDFDTRELLEWGFDISELADHGIEISALSDDGSEQSEVDTEPQIDKAEELRAKWGVEVGQLWQLDTHRLLCGDSTKAVDVARVMGGEEADLCVTSPPYGQQRDYRDGATAHVADWDALMKGAFGNLPMVESGQVFVNLGLIHRDGEWVPYWDGWIQWMRQQGWRRFGWYVWDQGSGLPGDWAGRFAPSHEFVFHFNHQTLRPVKSIKKKPDSKPVGSNIRGKDGKNKKPSSMCADTTKIPDSVIRINRANSRSLGHPAIFPIKLPAEFMMAWHGLVYDPFLGSGTTIIAAEQLNRRCYAIEISPAYVAVALERFFQATGKTPSLLG